MSINGYCFEIPVEVVSEANLREHWSKRYKRSKNQRAWAKAKMALEARPMIYCSWNGGGRFHVTLIRIMALRQRKFDGDNLQSAFKAIRDGIADALGIDDGSDRLTWEYRQEKGDKPSVRVEIRECS